MTTAMVNVESQALEVGGMSEAQKDMIRDKYAPGASPEEFEVLWEIAKVRNLNPLLQQIYFVKRWAQGRGEVWATQVSIEGLRVIANRTGKYDGQDEPIYEEVGDGFSKDIVKCTVRVYRKDLGRPSVGVVYFREFVQKTKDGKPTKFWHTMPHVMIAKCAEAQAMRKAFPEDMGGLYINEEMDQADNGRVPYDVDGVVVEPSGPQLVSAPVKPVATENPEVADLLRSVFATARNPADLAEAVKQTRKAQSEQAISDATYKELVALHKSRKAELAATIASDSAPEAEGTAAAQ